MNLKYIKVSLVEMLQEKKLFHHIFFFLDIPVYVCVCVCVCVYIYIYNIILNNFHSYAPTRKHNIDLLNYTAGQNLGIIII